MLDKSVPFVRVIMCRKKGTIIPVFDLPEGYKFSFFRSGDEKAWAKIETSVSEFPNEEEAFLHFQKEFLPFITEFEKRCLFIENNEGEKIATSTAWWFETGERRDPRLHWVAVMPQYQGLGLGKVITSKTMQVMAELEGDRDFYLSTQTWSHRAIRLYEKMGFEITDERDFHQIKNENYEKAIEVLKKVVSRSRR